MKSFLCPLKRTVSDVIVTKLPRFPGRLVSRASSRTRVYLLDWPMGRLIVRVTNPVILGFILAISCRCGIINCSADHQHKGAPHVTEKGSPFYGIPHQTHNDKTHHEKAGEKPAKKKDNGRIDKHVHENGEAADNLHDLSGAEGEDNPNWNCPFCTEVLVPVVIVPQKRDGNDKSYRISGINGCSNVYSILSIPAKRVDRNHRNIFLRLPDHILGEMLHVVKS